MGGRNQAPIIDVSVVTPVYNSAETIEQTVRSVLANDNVQVEIITVVDGSPDNSADILRALQKEIPQLIVMEHENVGGAKTLNRGLRAARGRYVTFLDGDDWLEDGALDRLVAMCDRDGSQIGIGYLLKWREGVVSHIFDQLGAALAKPITNIEIDDWGANLLADGFYSGKIFDRTFLLKENIWFNPLLLYADRPFLNAAEAAATRISKTNDAVGYWRKASEGGSSITDKRADLGNFIDRLNSSFEGRDQLRARVPISGRDKALANLDRIIAPRLLWIVRELSFFQDISDFTGVAKFYLNSISTAWYTAKKPNGGFYLRSRNRGRLRVLRDHKVKSRFSLLLKRLAFNTLRLSKPPKALKPKGHFKPHAFPADPTLVVFESFFGKEYGGQPRYIYEELLKSDKYFKPVWVINPERETPLDIPGDPIVVTRGSADYFSYLSRAGFWVNNIRFPIYDKPKGTTYLQTWHGTPLKRLSGDIEIASGPEVAARDDAIRESRLWDFMLSQNDYSSEIFARAYDLQCPVLTAGYPATDALMAMEPGNPQLRAKLGIPEGKKVAVYAPKWRDSLKKPGKAWKFGFELPFDPQKLLEALGDDYVLALRMHHLVTLDLPPADMGRTIFDVSKVDDATEVLGLTDLLISDYSSIFCDYAATGRPMIFYMNDRAAYESEMRGFYLDPDRDLPGPVVETQEALLKACREVSAGQIGKDTLYDGFRERYLSLQDGASAQRIVEQVFAAMPDKY